MSKSLNCIRTWHLNNPRIIDTPLTHLAQKQILFLPVWKITYSQHTYGSLVYVTFVSGQQWRETEQSVWPVLCPPRWHRDVISAARPHRIKQRQVDCDSSLLQPYLCFLYKPLAAAVIIMAATEEARQSSLKSKKSLHREKGKGWSVRLNLHRNFTQKTAACIQCETRSQLWVFWGFFSWHLEILVEQQILKDDTHPSHSLFTPLPLNLVR